jgi:hypothetical protein
LSRSATREHQAASALPIQPDAEKPALGIKRHHFISKHLHVPGHRKADPSGQEQTGEDSQKEKEGASQSNILDVILDRRVISSGSSIYSRHTTSAQSHYQPSSTPPPPPPTKSDPAGTNVRSPVETKLLAELWLHIAATFRRSGQLDQAFAAIQEAEVADVDNSEVWVQVRRLGLFLQISYADLP